MDDTHQFLNILFAPYQSLYRPELRLEIRCLGPRGTHHDNRPPRGWWPLTPSGLSAAAKTAVGKSWAGRWDCYMGVLPRLGQQGGQDAAPYAGALWCEIDGQTEGQDGALTLLEDAIDAGHVPLPALMVQSGGGIHGYWPLAITSDLTDGGLRRRFISILRRLAVAIGGVQWSQHGVLKPINPSLPFADPSCCEPARILRVPGTFNHKPSRQCAVKLCYINPAYQALPLSWWSAHLPVEPAPPERPSYGSRHDGSLPLGTIAKVSSPAPHGQRHAERVDIAVSAAKSGLDQEAINILLDTQAQVCGSPPHVYVDNRLLARWAYHHAR